MPKLSTKYNPACRLSCDTNAVAVCRSSVGGEGSQRKVSPTKVSDSPTSENNSSCSLLECVDDLIHGWLLLYCESY